MKEEKSVSLTDLAEEFSPDELSYLAGILAKHDGVSAEWKDALEYVNVIRQEDENLRLGNAAQAQLGEIEKYLEKLKQQKK